METVYLLRYGEVFLKGQNKRFFEQKAAENIRLFCKRAGIDAAVELLRNRLLLFAVGDKDVSFLSRVFGLVSYSPAAIVPATRDAIQESTGQILLQATTQKEFTSFRISTQRLTKDVPFTSQQLNRELGAFVMEKFAKKVDLSSPELVLGVEIIGGDAYLFTETIAGAGGLPTGTEGRVALFFDGSSPREQKEALMLAGLLMMKRGCSLLIGLGQEEALSAPDTAFMQAFAPARLRLAIDKKEKFLQEAREKNIPLVSHEMLSQLGGTEKPAAFYPLISYTPRQIAEELIKYRRLAGIP